MDTTLPPRIEQLIHERLRRGSYKSATEVIEDAFEALAERENFENADEQLAQGEYSEYDETTLHETVGGARDPKRAFKS